MEAPKTVTVPVKSDWASKINWTNVISFIATLATLFGFTVPPELIPQVVAAIAAITPVINVILRTWFTKEITKSSV